MTHLATTALPTGGRRIPIGSTKDDRSGAREHAEDWQTDSPTLCAGAWLFRRRSWVPLPVPIALLTLSGGEAGAPWFAYPGGALLVAAGVGLRLWAVRYIGPISRTRESEIGRLIVDGPYSLVRNPLYFGNFLLWSGLTSLAALPCLLPAVWAFLAFEYHCIVLWEEACLARRFGRTYQRYLDGVRRWIPDLRCTKSALRSRRCYSWTDSLHSEHDTLLMLAIMLTLLWLKGGT